MLESITIRNYAIIEDMEVGFKPGFSVITGETGAGKSVVIDALELVLGARASSDMVRSGTDELKVCGVFTLDEPPNIEGLPVEADENVLILCRLVRQDGNNRCYINGSPVTLKILKQLGDTLVDLHGQHDHQSLFNVSKHVHFLDGFGGSTELAAHVRRLYNRYNKVRESITDLENRIHNAERDRELYRYQIEEIDEARIQPGEDKSLEVALERLSSAAELKEIGMRAFEKLSESETSVDSVLGVIAADAERYAKSDPELKALVERLNEIIDGVTEVSDGFRRYADAIEDDPEALSEVESRVALIERLKKKYGPTLDEVIAHRERIGGESETLENAEDELEGLRRERDVLEKELVDEAKSLSKKRSETAPELSRIVESHLEELGMEGAKLVIELAPNDSGLELSGDSGPAYVSKDGLDSVEFLFSANPGEPPRALARIASGGEISRVMLSLKMALSDVADVPTMIFDEVDSGVSGRVAEAVGRKIRELSEKRQVIAITHLPQIAGKADEHFSARKTITDGRTTGALINLDDDARQRELAEMLSGDQLTDAALKHARELMNEEKRR